MITKIASIAQQMIIIKGFVDLLNDLYPVTTDGIPTQSYRNRVLVDLKVKPHPHFTATQSKLPSPFTKLPYWWINCTCYHSWSNPEYFSIQKNLQLITKESGFEVSFCFLFVAGLQRAHQEAKDNKAIFIGKYQSSIVD